MASAPIRASPSSCAASDCRRKTLTSDLCPLLRIFWCQFGDDFRNLSKRSLLNQEKICYRQASSLIFLRLRLGVFLRAVNVGSANRCQPALIAKELAKFGVVNIGAVGTFVVREG